MYYDPANKQILIEKDKIYFVIEKNEAFPIMRGVFSAIQRFYRRREVKS